MRQMEESSHQERNRKKVCQVSLSGGEADGQMCVQSTHR